MSTKEDKKARRRSVGSSRTWSSAGENSSADDSVRSHTSLGDLKRAVLGRAKSTGASSTESLAIELSEQPQHNFSSSESNSKQKKDKAAKKLKRRSVVVEEPAVPVVTTASSSTTPPLIVATAEEESSLGRKPSQSYSEPTERTRSLSHGQRATLDQHAAFSRDLRQLAQAQREQASQIAILRAEVEKLGQMEMARQRVAIEDRVRQIDEDTACCGCQCCGGLWDCLF